MSREYAKDCPTCGRGRELQLRCDGCGKVDSQMPVQVEETLEGDYEETHYCSVDCFVKADVDIGDESWHRTDVRLAPSALVRLLGAARAGGLG